MGRSAVVQYGCRFRLCALPRMSRRVKIRGFSFSELTVSRNQVAVSRICGRGGIGRLGGFRCCHLSEGFPSRCHCEPDRLSGVAIRSLKTGIACFYKPWIRLSAPPRFPRRVKIRGTKEYAGMAELADVLDLGSSALQRVGSNPTIRTNRSNDF